MVEQVFYLVKSRCITSDDFWCIRNYNGIVSIVQVADGLQVYFNCNNSLFSRKNALY